MGHSWLLWEDMVYYRSVVVLVVMNARDYYIVV